MLLDRIRDTSDVRSLRPEQLPGLAREIREFLVAAVSRTGGHLGPNLGAVELTIALHRVFTSPRDRILFDTGHQAYAHKLLTGRQAHFARLRQPGGLSGYPNQAESEHDVIENSHASTALSYADGLAKAYERTGQTDRAVVAVVGDGALTGGMAWEALNNLGGARHRSVVIVLNDNGRSYSPTVGGLAAHLAQVRKAAANGAANGAGTRTVFDQLGLSYLGPVDGHDTLAVEQALRQARALGGPVVVHCLTTKGRGYLPAEDDEEDCLHSPGAFDPATGRQLPRPGPSWTEVFGAELVRIGAERDDVVALTAAMLHPAGLGAFARAFPGRVYDVGIAEQHAVTSAAGLALGGLHPVVAVYATFLSRAFDQVLMDVALHRLPVTFVLDRAGLTGDDGASHNGMWDLSILQVVPGLRIAVPRDGTRLRELLREAVAAGDGPTAVRFPKGQVPDDVEAVGTLGGMDVLARRGAEDVLLVGAGPMAGMCAAAAELLVAQGIGVTVVDPRWVTPLDTALAAAADRHLLVAVMEDNGRVGGVGDAVARLLRDSGVDTPVRSFGVPQAFLAHGKRAQLLADAGLCPQNLARAVTEWMSWRARTPVRTAVSDPVRTLSGA